MLIYKAYIKLNNKCYIGKTEHSLDSRKQAHLYSVKQGSKFAFHKAIAKYGLESFEWTILDETNNTQELNQKEQYYIKLFESFGIKGYNMTAGGEGQTGWNPSESTRELWSIQRKGKTPWNKGIKTVQPQFVTEEQKEQKRQVANQKRSNALKGRSPWNTGLSNIYSYTKYKVTYKDNTEKIGTKLDLGLPKNTIDTMFRDKCGSRKYNIKKIERL